MGIIIIITSTLLITVALYIQWKDCIKGYGNTMGVYNLINTIWLFAGIFMGIGISRFIPWYWATVCGIVFYALYYPITYLVEKLGIKYGPRQNNTMN